MVMELANTDLIVQSGSYMASTMDIDVNTTLGRSSHLLRRGRAIHASLFGNRLADNELIRRAASVDLNAGQEFIIDTGHVVAFDSHMTYEVQKFGSWKSTIAGGEGFVVNFNGPGTVHLQTRSQQSLLDWIIPNIPTDRSN